MTKKTNRDRAIDTAIAKTHDLVTKASDATISKMFCAGVRQSADMCIDHNKAGLLKFLSELEAKDATPEGQKENATAFRNLTKSTLTKGDDKMILKFCEDTCMGIIAIERRS